jgi:predicted deacylase
MNKETIIDSLDLHTIKPETISYFWLTISYDGISQPIRIPIIVAKGKSDHPVVGLTAAVHGNELNGIFVIQRLFNEIQVDSLEGVIIGVPVVNVPSYLAKQRRYLNNVDLNHIMPGKDNGNVSQEYAHQFFSKVIKKFDYLVDLHTASQGRINSFYVRADLKHPIVRKMAFLQNAQIIVHNPPSDGTLRGAADEIDIPALTLEVGNPNSQQNKMVKSGIIGIHNVLSYLEMIPDSIIDIQSAPVVCSHSYWLYTDVGGLLRVDVNLTDLVSKGQKIAVVRNIFGAIIKEYFAPEDGIVIGKSVSPVNQSGGRILHLGIVKTS